MHVGVVIKASITPLCIEAPEAPLAVLPMQPAGQDMRHVHTTINLCHKQHTHAPIYH